MAHGFTFKGRHTSEFGITVTQRNIPILPRYRDLYEEIPGRDGSIDMSDGTVEDRLLTFTCEFNGREYGGIRSIARQVAEWLYSKDMAQLVLDDDPDVYYRARVVNQLDLEEITSIGEFTIEFRADPFAYAGPTAFDRYYEYDTGLIYANPTGFNWRHITQTSGLYNYGAPTPLSITLVGSVASPKITNVDQNQTLILPTIANQTMFIDGVNMDVLIDGVSVLPEVSGEFPTLRTGANGLRFDGGTVKNKPNVVVTYEWANHLR